MLSSSYISIMMIKVILCPENNLKKKKKTAKWSKENMLIGENLRLKVIMWNIKALELHVSL